MREEYVKQFFNSLGKKKIYHSPKSLYWYYDSYLFKEIDFKDKKVLDVGGGIGLASAYAALCGASEVVLLEPESAGSESVQMKKTILLKDILGSRANHFFIEKKTLQDYSCPNNHFDIVIFHNSINHLDENACIHLLNNKKYWNLYKGLFEKIKNLMSDGGSLIITDCMNRNFFNSIGLKNPLAYTIEWNKHQHPKVWAELLQEVGFRIAEIKWSSFKQLRNYGQILFGNELASYFFGTSFKIFGKL
jgi:SAM-dependent methyltransferase